MIKEKEEIYKTKFSSLESHTFFGNEMYFKLSQTLRQFQIKVSAAAVIHTPILIAIFYFAASKIKIWKNSLLFKKSSDSYYSFDQNTQINRRYILLFFDNHKK